MVMPRSPPLPIPSCLWTSGGDIPHQTIYKSQKITGSAFVRPRHGKHLIYSTPATLLPSQSPETSRFSPSRREALVNHRRHLRNEADLWLAVELWSSVRGVRPDRHQNSSTHACHLPNWRAATARMKAHNTLEDNSWNTTDLAPARIRSSHLRGERISDLTKAWATQRS